MLLPLLLTASPSWGAPQNIGHDRLPSQLQGDIVNAACSISEADTGGLIAQ
jgi:hypothetical protein